MRAIVLAAGKGSRMLSTVPKPLHLVNGLPMARHILKSLEEIYGRRRRASGATCLSNFDADVQRPGSPKIR